MTPKKEIIDINGEGFVGIEYENNDVDTDRGVLRDRCFCLVFKNCQIFMSEEDFSKLLIDSQKYIED